MKQFLYFVLLALLRALFIWSTGCNAGKISGIVTQINKDTVTVVKTVITTYRFRVKKLPNLGDSATFTPSVVRKKFNSNKVHSKN